MFRPLVLVALVGCASEARLPASYFGEGGRVLDPGHVAVTGAVGAGGTTEGTGSGGGGRVRVGIGDGQEIGVEAAQLTIDSPSDHCTGFDCEPGENLRYTMRSRSALVSWKRQVRPSVALLAGVGVSHHEWVSGDPDPVGDYKGESVNGMFGFIGSRRINDALEVYMGARIVGATPIREYPMVDGHGVIGISSGIGAILHVSSFVGVFGEIGPRVTASGGGGLTFGSTAVGGLSITL
jgi:hypothetical protein